MSHLQTFVRSLVVMVLAFGFMASAVSVTSAQDGDGVNAQVIGRDTFAGNDDLVQQLIQVLIEILNDLLNGGDDLADLLPEGCNVEDVGFICNITSGEASLFISETCETSIFNDDIYLCPIAGVVYSCNIYGNTDALICNPS